MTPDAVAYLSSEPSDPRKMRGSWPSLALCVVGIGVILWFIWPQSKFNRHLAIQHIYQCPNGSFQLVLDDDYELGVYPTLFDARVSKTNRVKDWLAPSPLPAPFKPCGKKIE